MKKKIILTSVFVLFLVVVLALISCDDSSDTNEEGGTIRVRNISSVNTYHVRFTSYEQGWREVLPNGVTTRSFSNNGTYQIEYQMITRPSPGTISHGPLYTTSTYVSNGRTVEVQVP